MKDYGNPFSSLLQSYLPFCSTKSTSIRHFLFFKLLEKVNSSISSYTVFLLPYSSQYFFINIFRDLTLESIIFLMICVKNTISIIIHTLTQSQEKIDVILLLNGDIRSFITVYQQQLHFCSLKIQAIYHFSLVARAVPQTSIMIFQKIHNFLSNQKYSIFCNLENI